MSSCRASSAPACLGKVGVKRAALTTKHAKKARSLEQQSKKEEGAWKEEGWGARMSDMNKILALKQCSVASVVKWFIPTNTSAFALCQVPRKRLEPSFKFTAAGNAFLSSPSPPANLFPGCMWSCMLLPGSGFQKEIRTLSLATFRDTIQHAEVQVLTCLTRWIIFPCNQAKSSSTVTSG